MKVEPLIKTEVKIEPPPGLDQGRDLMPPLVPDEATRKATQERLIKKAMSELIAKLEKESRLENM